MNMLRSWVGLWLVGVLGAAGLARGAENDSFDSAAIIQGLSAQVAGNNNGCSADETEPAHYPDCPAAHSVWWKWTPEESGHVTIHTLGSDFDTVLAVYTGATLGELALVACGDDWGVRTESLVEFDAVDGVEYRIAVDGRDGAVGEIRLTVRSDAAAAPSNGTFEGRTVVSGPSVDESGSNDNAMAEEQSPRLAGLAAVAPVWWSWTASKTCIMEADTRGSGIDTVLGVYTGSVLSVLREVAGNNDCGTDPAARLWWPVEAGTTYQIAVDGAGGAWGTIQLSLREVERPVIVGVGAGTVRWSSLTGECYRVWRSTNLVNWAEETTLVAVTTEAIANFAEASAPRAFYRVERYLP